MTNIPGWEELKELLTKVARLTGNVSSLMEQTEKNTNEVSALKAEITQLRADIRVAKAELEASATRTAVSTVIQAHEQILTRVINLENGSASKPSGQLDRQ